ncbi:MAG: heterodisulfide reductase-related iron-sulfur binding cluster [Candidatus Acidiferrales bacterium]
MAAHQGIQIAAAPKNSAGCSAFDSHHPPPAKLIDECVHCGFCLPTCPTYSLWGEEMDSPRGRIYLMKMASEGLVQLEEPFVQHFDSCLGCMACMTACPSGVKYDKLFESTRAQIVRNYSPRLSERILRAMILSLFPNTGRLRVMAKFLWLYQRSGLQSLARSLGISRILPERLRAMESLLPDLTRPAASARMPAQVAAQGEQRLRVGLLLGCVQSVFFSDVNAATARVLAAEGCEVIMPPAQGCCGSLMMHSGWEKEGLDRARALIDAFAADHVDVIVTNAAGCGSNLKNYGYQLRDDPQYASKAADFAVRCKDISEVLAMLPPRAERGPLALRVAYHDACHLQHAQGVRSAPREVLGTIPGLEILEVPESAICCGSAGIYNMMEPVPARELGDRKVKNCLGTGAQLIASSNPGCLLQLQAGMARAGQHLPVVHMIELLDASLRHQPAKSLLPTAGVRASSQHLR